jgi:hypothetical protein
VAAALVSGWQIVNKVYCNSGTGRSSSACCCRLIGFGLTCPGKQSFGMGQTAIENPLFWFGLSFVQRGWFVASMDCYPCIEATTTLLNLKTMEESNHYAAQIP